MIIRIPLFLAAFITAFLAGYKTGDKLDPFGSFKFFTDNIEEPGVPIPENDQVNILLIGVDDLNRKDAQLEGVWLAAYTNNTSKINFIPVFPSEDTGNNMKIADKFSLDRGKPVEEFWDALREYNFWWSGYLIGDKAATINMINDLGGFRTHGYYMDGEEAVNNITSWEDDPWISINQQKLFINSICNLFSERQSNNLKDINEILDQNFQTTIQADLFISRMTAETNHMENLTCIFPTLTKTSFRSGKVTTP